MGVLNGLARSLGGFGAVGSSLGAVDYRDRLIGGVPVEDFQDTRQRNLEAALNAQAMRGTGAATEAMQRVRDNLNYPAHVRWYRQERRERAREAREKYRSRIMKLLDRHRNRGWGLFVKVGP